MISKLGPKVIFPRFKKKESINSNTKASNGMASLLSLININNDYSSKGTSQKGLREGWTRVTFILKEEHIAKLKSLAYWERSTIKAVVDDALSMYFDNSNKKILAKDR